MPLIIHNNLPTYERLLKEGRVLLEPGRAHSQDIRELHIGFCNLMPDGVLKATERQFFRLIGESNRIAQFYMHPFTLPIGKRSDEIQSYIDQYYEPLEKIKEEGLDALIITGASEESNPHVSEESFWAPLKDLYEWASENVASTLCSCLASHAALTYLYDQKPVWRDSKRFGIFPHRVIDRTHPLVFSMNTLFNAPHSKYNEITKEQFEGLGFHVLAEGEEAGVHVATSPDGIRLVCFQAHPEYDTFSLLKEYRRDIEVYRDGGRPDYPPLPANYFRPDIEQKMCNYQKEIESGKDPGAFPEEELESTLDNTWTDSARAMIGNWIGCVYQITHMDRRKQYMDHIDPDNPLKWKSS